MSKEEEPRKRLVAAVARAEMLRRQNDQDRDHLDDTLDKMGDHAGKYAEGLRKRVLAGDPDATREAQHALSERYRARQLRRAR